MIRTLWRAMVISFAMYSKIPMPKVDWTEENMKYSIEEVPDSKKKRTGVVTNSFHMYRAVMLGKYVGYENLYPVTAKSEPVLFLNYLLREILAVLVFPVRSIWKAGKMSIDI